MDMHISRHISGDRLQFLSIEANTFMEERFLWLLFNAIISGGQVKIHQGKGQKPGEDIEGESTDLLEDEGYVIKFNKNLAANE